MNLEGGSVSVLDRPEVATEAGARERSPAMMPAVIAFATLAIVLGSGFVLPVWLKVYGVWARDPLRALGACFPFVCVAGVVLAWRRTGWASRGSSYGWLLIGAAAVLAQIAVFKVPVLVTEWAAFALVPCGVAAFLYGVGAVLLFGGTRLVRAAAVPLCLLLCINPVPGWYTHAVDAPLQQISARTARLFAHVIGLHPTGENLKMLFAPNFGMMIVPGCDGVRGSITLAYLALIFGYYCRLRPRRLLAVVVGALFTGFLLNLVRLCVLVIYYRVGLSWPLIQHYGTSVDYVIGGTIFLTATIALGAIIRRLGTTDAEAPRLTRAEKPDTRHTRRRTLLYASILSASVLVFMALQWRAVKSFSAPPLTRETASQLLPVQVGDYHLLRTHSEMSGGRVAFILGDYRRDSDRISDVNQLTLGMWLNGPDHLVYASKRLQDLRPLWAGSMDVQTSPAASTHFFESLYDDGTTHQWNAETMCSEAGCTIGAARQTGVHIESVPGRLTARWSNTFKRLPVLIRAEWPSGDDATDPQQRAAFEKEVDTFFRQLQLADAVRVGGSTL